MPRAVEGRRPAPVATGGGTGGLEAPGGTERLCDNPAMRPPHHRFALEPTALQGRALASHVGAARFAFNWGLEQVQAGMALARFEAVMGLPRSARQWRR